jgi:WD40 repeat protein
MSSQDAAVEGELYFLMAQFIEEKLPEVHEPFVRACEEHGAFIRSVFQTKRSYESLRDQYSEVPADQLLTLIKQSRPKSLLSIPREQSASQTLGLADILIHQLTPPRKPTFVFPSRIEIDAHESPVFCVASDRTSQILITGSDDVIVKIWRLPSGNQIGEIGVHAEKITNIAIHPSNQFFMTSSEDCTVRLFSMPDFEEFACIPTTIPGIALFSNTGSYLALSMEGHIFLWPASPLPDFEMTLDNAIIHFEVQDHDGATPVAFSPGDRFLAVDHNPSSITIFSLETGRSFTQTMSIGEILFVTFGHETCDYLLAVSPTSAVFLHTQVTLLDSIFPLTFTSPVSNAQFTCDDARIVAVAHDSIGIFATHSRQWILTIRNSEYITSAWSCRPHPAISNIAVVICDNGRVSIWDIERGIRLHVLECMGDDLAIEGVWTTDGTHFAIGWNGGSIAIHGRGGIDGGTLRLDVQPNLIHPYEAHRELALVKEGHAEFFVPLARQSRVFALSPRELRRLGRL